MRRTDAATRARIAELRAEGLSAIETAQRTGVRRATVYIIEKGGHRIYGPTAVERRARVRELKRDGLTLREIADAEGLSLRSVSRYLSASTERIKQRRAQRDERIRVLRTMGKTYREICESVGVTRGTARAAVTGITIYERRHRIGRGADLPEGRTPTPNDTALRRTESLVRRLWAEGKT